MIRSRKFSINSFIFILNLGCQCNILSRNIQFDMQRSKPKIWFKWPCQKPSVWDVFVFSVEGARFIGHRKWNWSIFWAYMQAFCLLIYVHFNRFSLLCVRNSVTLHFYMYTIILVNIFSYRFVFLLIFRFQPFFFKSQKLFPFFLQAWYLVVMWLHDFVQLAMVQWSVCWIVLFTVSCMDTICSVHSMKMLKHRFGGKNTLHKFNSSNFCYWVYTFRLPFLLSIVHTRNYFVSLWRFKICLWCSCFVTSTERHTYEKKTID